MHNDISKLSTTKYNELIFLIQFCQTLEKVTENDKWH